MRDVLYFARRKYFGLLVACVVFQLGLSLFILIDDIQNDDLGFKEAPPVEIGFTRFIAAMVLHIIMNDEIYNGLKMIKYSVNHPWKFSNAQMAFATGFLQATSMFIISIINFAVISSSESVLDIAKDFTALAIIAEFDDIFAVGLGDEKANDICENADGVYDGLLRIEVTTSIHAKGVGSQKLPRDKVLEEINKHRRA